MPEPYKRIAPHTEGVAVAHRRDGKAVLLDERGRELRLPRRFRWILPFSGGRARACTVDGAVGWLELSGEFSEESVDPEWTARVELVRVARLIYERDYNATIDGNLSCRLGEDEVLITPSGAHNGFLDPADLVVMDLDGRTVRGTGNPTSEFRLHTRIYRRRDDIRCVIHVHAPYALAASLAGIDLHQTFVTMAPIPTTKYARISSAQSPEVLEPYIQDYSWAILPRHGPVAWADTIWNAFLRIEGLEHFAKVVLAAAACGPLTPMSAEHRKELLAFWNLLHQERP
jgi:L-fuculose-phosphate aldolase